MTSSIPSATTLVMRDRAKSLWLNAALSLGFVPVAFWGFDSGQLTIRMSKVAYSESNGRITRHVNIPA